jgi:hypothetical protein
MFPEKDVPHQAMSMVSNYRRKMKRVILKPNNKKLKQVIKEHGDTYRLIDTGERGYLCESMDLVDLRWVDVKDAEVIDEDDN